MWKIRRHSPPGFRRVLAEAGVLVLITLLLASLSWIARRPIPLKADFSVYTFELDFPLINVEDAIAAYEAGSHYFVDVRALDMESVARIPGAFSIRLDSFDADLGAVLDFIYPEDSLILYADQDLQTLAAVAQKFDERGYPNIDILSAGIEAWAKAGGELTEAGRE